MNMPARSRRAVIGRSASLALACTLLAGGCGKSEFRPPWAGGVPPVADVNRDGVEDMISFGHAYGFTAFDGTTYEPLWTRKDLDVIGNNGRLGAVAGRRAVVAVGRSLELIELADGKTVSTLPLSDKIARICADGELVWIRQLDEVQGTIDVSAATPAFTVTKEPPPGCVSPLWEANACKHAHARCERSNPPASEFKLTDEAAAPGAPGASITIEFKEPGTPEVTLVLPGTGGAAPRRILYDREGGRIDAADLGGGKLFLKGVGGITAVDAATGRSLWRLPCGGNTPYLRATATRVYAECAGHRQHEVLRVLDHNGKVLRDFGESPY